MARIIKTNGEERTVVSKNGKDFSLEEMRAVVGGYIEILFLESGDLMVVNEEGKLLGLPINAKATDIITRDKYYDGDTIVGDVLVCERNQIQ